MNRIEQIRRLEQDWQDNPRWRGIKRGYTASDVINLRGSLNVEHSIARRGAERLWQQLTSTPFVNALGALTGNQLVHDRAFFISCKASSKQRDENVDKDQRS